MSYDPRLYSSAYIEVSNDTYLTGKRIATAGNNLFNVDGGANTTFTQQVLKQATQSTTALLVATSSSVQYGDSTGGAFAITLPAASSCVDKVFLFNKLDSSANAVTVTAASPGDTINAATTYALSNQYDFVMIQSNGVANWRIIGRSYGTGSFAPADATYLALSTNATLTVERVLTAGKNVFFTDAGAGSTLTVEVNTVSAGVTGSPTLTGTSNTVQLINAAGGAEVITLSTAATVKTFRIKKVDSSANTVTVTRAGSDTIDGATTYVLTSQYQSVDLVSSGGTAWNIM